MQYVCKSVLVKYVADVAGVIIISFYYFTQNPYVLLLVTNVYIFVRKGKMYFIYKFRARVTVVTALALRALASVRERSEQSEVCILFYPDQKRVKIEIISN